MRGETVHAPALVPVIETEPRDPSHEPTWHVVDLGNFCHGECLECRWQGPGRRARSSARRDAELHSLTGCGDVAQVRSLFPPQAFPLR
ncbi:hypothetical protein ADJ73_01370 [Arsenicicoccus sp. oral taxon 190]|nr:hypothetical protein ADJ73_01370 [Arsenicicoccus sp. oral taxon 190]